MAIPYSLIQIYTSEETKWRGRPVQDSVLDHVRKAGTAARCIVTRCIAGCYENGDMATNSIEVLSFNMPIKIEIVLPKTELADVLPGLEAMVTDGIILVQEAGLCSHRTLKRLIPRQIRVKDAMTLSPMSINPATPVPDIVKQLLKSPFGAFPVVDEMNRPVGIITRGDLMQKAGIPLRLGLLAELESQSIAELLKESTDKLASDVMTSNPVTVREDKRLSEAVNLMLENSLKRLPVVNASGVICGMLARVDVFRVITKAAPAWQAINAPSVEISDISTVGDIMNREMHTVQPEAAIEEIAAIIDDNDIQRVAVVDDSGRLLGLISDKDLLILFSEGHPSFWNLVSGKMPFLEMAKQHAPQAGVRTPSQAKDVMHTELITVSEDTGVSEAIELMTEHSIKRLPVVDPGGKFLGMVSRDAVLRAGIIAK